MTLDINALRAKMQELTKRTPNNIAWKPTEGTTLIRIVPLASNPKNPFTEAHFHYGLGGKTYLSPITFGRPDPIQEFAQSLRAEGNLSKEAWNETKKFVPKMRTYVPVIVRGKEAEGVKFWGFGKEVLLELLKITSDEDTVEMYGDVTDVNAGRDIKVTFLPAEKSPTGFAKTTLVVSPKKTPLVTGDNAKELANKILHEQPNLFESFTEPTYDELKEALQKYLAPSTGANVAPSPATTDTAWDEFEPEVTTAPVTPTKVSQPSSQAKNVVDEFDALFNS